MQTIDPRAGQSRSNPANVGHIGNKASFRIGATLLLGADVRGAFRQARCHAYSFTHVLRGRDVHKCLRKPRTTEQESSEWLVIEAGASDIAGPTWVTHGQHQRGDRTTASETVAAIGHGQRSWSFRSGQRRPCCRAPTSEAHGQRPDRSQQRDRHANSDEPGHGGRVGAGRRCRLVVGICCLRAGRQLI
jgi:hypothetical protein